MTALSEIQNPLEVARSHAACYEFVPRGTVRCVGTPMFRSQIARDVGCLLDIDRSVTEWSCLSQALRAADKVHVPDFRIMRPEGIVLVDAVETGQTWPDGWVEGEAVRQGFFYERLDATAVRRGVRLANARDILRYARWNCPLGDRVRLLAALDENGSMTVAECMPAFRETQPIAGLSSLILHRFVEVDLDETRIGPETQVRRSHC